MIRTFICFVILTVSCWGTAQTTEITLIPAERIPDTPLGYVTFMYEDPYMGTENKDLNIDNAKLLNNTIGSSFTNIVKPYIVVFSPNHSESMVQEQTERLLKKWDFENNYPYHYLLILSNYAPKLIFGKHLPAYHHKQYISMVLSIEMLWKTTNTQRTYTRLSKMVKRLKSLNIGNDVVLSEDYLTQWNKKHFFNYSKTVSEKQEAYINKLLEEVYHKENLRFWIIFAPTVKNKELVAELLQKADFNSHSNQGIILLSSEVFKLDVILTKDLQTKWNTYTESQITQSARFYYDKGWYYDALKETFLMTKEELLYKTISFKKGEEEAKTAYLEAESKKHYLTMKSHKALFWIIAIVLLLPLVFGKLYIEKKYAGEAEAKIKNMKLVIEISYVLILGIVAIYIASYTPLFYTNSSLVKFVDNILIWMLAFVCAFFGLHLIKADIVKDSVNIKTLPVVVITVYFLCFTLGYVFNSQEEWISQNTGSSKDFLNSFIAIPLSVFIFNQVSKKRRVNAAVSSMKSLSSRKGFGKREYVSKYIAK